MYLKSNSLKHLNPIDKKYAFCKLGEPVDMSDNLNPHLTWGDAPEKTKSFALVVYDESVPSKADDVNQPDRKIPETLPRIEFIHWLLVNIPATLHELKEGEFSNGITPGGKSGPEVEGSVMKQGINDYTNWFAGDPNMKGEYYGYDGPAPPWNDSILHKYHFTLYALDIDNLDLPTPFNRDDLTAAINSHILAEATLTGYYTLTPDLLPKLEEKRED